MGCGSPNKGPESRSFFHYHSAPEHDMADASLHHIQPTPGGRRGGQRQCGGGQPSQTVKKIINCALNDMTCFRVKPTKDIESVSRSNKVSILVLCVTMWSLFMSWALQR